METTAQIRAPARGASSSHRGRRSIRRKPVPQSGSSARPSSSRSFVQAFAWLSGALLGPDQTPTVPEDAEPNHQIRMNRNSYRWTSQFDPRMESGLTLFDPELDSNQLQHRLDKSTRSSVIDGLDVGWELPPLRWSFTDDNAPPLMNIAIEASANALPSPGDTPPPNGGSIAWLQVLGAFFCYFNSWGIMNSFGVFQTYYELNADWHRDASEIAWIGSIQAFLSLMIGVFTGPLYDAGYFRYLIWTGAILVPLGFMMTSISTQYWQVILAQGVAIGIGNGCLFVPSVAILPQYFTTKNPIVNGIAASGSSIGGVVMPFAFTRLAPQIGFGWATRVVGFVCLATILISVAVMRPRIQPKSKRRLFEISAFKEPSYSLFTAGFSLSFIGFAIPAFYLGTFASTTGVSSPEFSFYYLPILNAASSIGRIAPTFIAHKVGPLNLLIPLLTGTGALIIIWSVITNSAGTIAFAILYGLFSGGSVAMAPVALVTLTPDLRRLGTRMGQAFFFCALAILAGPPVSGALLRATGSWVALKGFAGGTVVFSSMFIVLARVSKVGWGVMKKA